MLNYIWGGLIIVSLVFAMISDVRDFAKDTYRNGQPLPVTVSLWANAYAHAADSTTTRSRMVLFFIGSLSLSSH